MSRSGSISSAGSIEVLYDTDRHPLLKGVYPPAPQTGEGLLTTEGHSFDAQEAQDPSDIITEDNDIYREQHGHNSSSMRMEIVSLPSSSVNDAGADDTCSGSLWRLFLLPALLVLSGLALVISYQLWMTSARMLDKSEEIQRFDNYTMVLFATFWPALFFWVVAYGWELLVRRRWKLLPEVSLWLAILTAAMSGAWLLIIIFATGEQRVSRDLQGVLAVPLVVFILVLRWVVLGRSKYTILSEVSLVLVLRNEYHRKLYISAN